jgi:hypothetical protein
MARWTSFHVWLRIPLLSLRTVEPTQTSLYLQSRQRRSEASWPVAVLRARFEAQGRRSVVAAVLDTHTYGNTCLMDASLIARRIFMWRICVGW